MLFLFLAHSHDNSLEYDPVPHFIDCFARLISDHLHVFAVDESLTLSVHRLLAQLIHACPNCNYCNLVADALNDFYNNLTFHYDSIKQECPRLLEVLVQRAVLPDYHFSSFLLLDENDPLRRFRQSAQDIALVLSNSFPGVSFTASALIEIGLKPSSPLAIEESTLYLFNGVVDAIEEHFMSFFSVDDLYDDEGVSSRSLQRTDIPHEPFKTEFDSILEYVFQRMDQYAQNPQLLVTALQVMFSFDNWTFSRGAYCRQLFEYLVQCLERVPVVLIPRLLHYLCRLYESPCFAVDASHIESLMHLSSHISQFHDLAVFKAYVQAISTSISSLPWDQAVEMYQRFLASYMSAIASLAVFVSQNEGSARPALTSQTVEEAMVSFKCIEAVFDGCVVESLANALSEAILPSMKQLFDGLVRWLKLDPTCDVSLLHEVCCVSLTIIKASGQQLTSNNCSVITSFCCELIQDSLFIRDALSIMDSVVTDSFPVLSQEQRYSFMMSIHSLFLWMAHTHAIKNEIDCVILILRIQYVFLKEDESELQSQQQLVQEIMQTTLQVASEQIIEDDFIRLLLRNIIMIATKYSLCVMGIYPDIVASCFSLASLNLPSRLHGLINGQLVQLLTPSLDLVPVMNNAVQRVFLENRLPVLSRFSEAFKQKCVVLLTSTRKSTTLRSHVNDVVSVLMGDMDEGTFASKYGTF